MQSKGGQPFFKVTRKAVLWVHLRVATNIRAWFLELLGTWLSNIPQPLGGAQHQSGDGFPLSIIYTDKDGEQGRPHSYSIGWSSKLLWCYLSSLCLSGRSNCCSQRAGELSGGGPGAGYALTHEHHPSGLNMDSKACAVNKAHRQLQPWWVDGPGPGFNWEQQKTQPEMGLFFCCCQAVQRTPTKNS